MLGRAVRWCFALALLAALFALDEAWPDAVVAAPGDIATFAGGGAGDGGGSGNAALNPQGIATDGAGNLYVADTTNCRVRKIAAGVITTIAGSGVCGYAGDGGAATSARLNIPTAVAIGTSGEIYIADTNNCRIRQVIAGTISTLTGSGICVFSGDGGPAAGGSVAYPKGIAVNASNGDLYIADTDNCRVRKIASGTITTVAGNGACGYAGDNVPATSTGITHAQGVVYDVPASLLYIADTNACRVRAVTAGGIIATVAGTGTCGYSGDGLNAALAQIDKPRAVTTDASGNLYIADTWTCRVRKVTFPATTIATVAGSAACGNGGDGGAATSAQLNLPSGVALDGPSLYIADAANCRVRRVSGGNITGWVGTGSCTYGGDGGPATEAATGSPGEITTDSAGNLYITDPNNCRIRKVSGGTMTTVAGNGACGYSGDGGPATAASLNAPRGVAVDNAGVIYIADSGNCRIRRVLAATITTIAGNGTCGYGGDSGPATSAALNYPQSVALSGTTVYVADTFNCRIRKVIGTIITTAVGDGACSFGGDGGPPALASLAFPYGVAADPAGAVYVADTTNCRVRKLAGGSVATISGTGVCEYGGDLAIATGASLNHPSGIGVTASGAVYIADTDNCRIRLISAGVILTVAGVGTGISFGGCGYGGDGGVATAATIDRPQDAATDAAGNIYISDGLNRRVRIVSAGADYDGDGVADAADNCPVIVNGGQGNNDRNFIDQTPPRSVDDLTAISSDEQGDACDNDDDNDTIADGVEAGGPPCPSASAATDPLLADSDGDRRLDRIECVLATDPASAASFPPTIVTPDADNDGVPDIWDPNDADFDSDDDGLRDGLEWRHYLSNVLNVNTDGDPTRDDCEVSSLNTDTKVNPGDQALLASEIIRIPPPPKLVNFDINKDGVLNPGDQAFQSSRALPGVCP